MLLAPIIPTVIPKGQRRSCIGVLPNTRSGFQLDTGSASYLLFLCSIAIGSIDTVVQATRIAEILALRVPPPQGRGRGTAVGTLATQVADLVRGRGA